MTTKTGWNIPPHKQSRYTGPSDSYTRYINGEIVTHCQFVTDTSSFVTHHIHPARLDRLRKMLTATTPKYKCDACQLDCPTRIKERTNG